MNRTKKYIHNNLLFLIVSFAMTCAFMIVFGCTTSPLYFANGQDSVVFQIIGKGILEGRIPYRDLEENKGPLLYFIEALAQIVVKGKMGVFFFQIINHITVLNLLYLFCLNIVIPDHISKMMKRFVDIIIPALYFCYLYICYEAGNLSEEYTNLFIAVLLITILKIDNADNIDRRLPSYFVSGMCYSAICMIRVSDVIAIVPILFIYVLIEIKNGLKLRRTITILTTWVGGFICMMAPILFWYIYKGALRDLLWGYLYINSNVIQGVEYRIDSFYEYTCLGVIITSIIATVISYRKNRVLILLPLWSLMFTVSVHISKSLFHHYLITGTLLFVISCITILTHSIKQNAYFMHIIRLALVTAIIIHCVNIWPLAQPKISKLEIRNNKIQNAPLYLNDYIDVDGKSVYAIDIRADWYQYNDIYPAYKIFHLSGYIGYDNSIREDFETFMEKTPPDLLFVASNDYEASLTNKTINIIRTTYKEIATDVRGNRLLQHIEN